MKKLFYLLIFLVAVFPVFSESPQKVIVLINGDIITEAEINYELEQLERQAMISGEQKKIPLNYAHIEELRNTVITTLINKHILLQECTIRGITIKPEIINQNLQSLKNQFPEEQQFHDFLKDSNISEEKLMDEIRIALSVDMLAIQLLKEENKDYSTANEIERQKALAALLTKLLKEADITWVD
ncbi:MAG: SurA N-terminal domain-containing protein [Spirochaetales bacterium]|nr:SurA N-terminal domain-containing protein [Spirochaetales bacterium]